MTSYDQIKRGIIRYINTDLAPVAPKPIGIGLAAFGPVVIESKMKQFFSSGLFSGTPLTDGNSVDVDEVYKLLKPAAENKWPIEMFGFHFTESDLDKIYRYIKEV
jgi:hypothetical protein